LYAIVDIGAGTSDISFFRLAGYGQRLSYYSTDTVPLGADNVDRRILAQMETSSGTTDLLPAERTELLAQIRIAKQAAATSRQRGHLGLDAAMCDAAAVYIGVALFKEYKRIWWAGYQKEKRQRTWENGFTVFVTGGGAELASTVHPLGSSPWPQIVRRVGLRRLVSRRESSRILRAPDIRCASSRLC